MSTIRFNDLTKEIELKGSESFIKSNFDKIEELLNEDSGVKRKMVSRRTKVKQEPISVSKKNESQTSIEMVKLEPPNSSQLSRVAEASMTGISHEIKANRPPLRKYIRKVGMPGQERIVVEVAEQKPKELSLASLKEKFGLSDSRIGGMIWDAEKPGKMRRVVNGSYA
jgi:hypothetical protein